MKQILTLAAAPLLGTSAWAGVVFVGVESGAPPSFQAQRWSLSTEKKNFAVTNNVFGGSGYYCLATSANLFDWERHPANPVYTAPSWVQTHASGWVDCRDAHIIRYGDEHHETHPHPPHSSAARRVRCSGG